MHERIKELRKALGLTQQKFADGMGVKQNTIAQYESGRNTPIDAVITLICRTYSVNETWLRTGEGEMFQPKSRNDELLDYARRIAEGDPSSIQAKILTAMTRLTDAQWEVLAQFAKSLLADTQPQSVSHAPDRNPTIEERVEAYRQELLAEEKGADGSSPSPPAANA